MGTQVPSADAVTEATKPVIGRTARELRESTPPEPDWLIPYILARGSTTEVNGREKAGKGWFETYLLGTLERGEPSIFGPSDPTNALIYTEEAPQSLKEKFEQFNLSEAMVIYHWELAGQDWRTRIVPWLVAKAVELGNGVLFIDNISAATGTEDENGVELARKVEPLARAAKEHNLAILYDRHMRKSAGDIRDRSRGGTALAGAVDQIVAMEMAAGNERKLTSWGRLFSTNWSRVVALNEAHNDFEDLGNDDWRERVMFDRPEWTAAEFGEALKQTAETAKQYLEAHPMAVRKQGRRGNAYVWEIKADNDRPDLS